MSGQQQQWSGKTYGNGWMHQSLVRLLGIMDVRVIYIFASLFIIPVVLLVNPSAGIIYRFMRRRMGYTVMRSVWKTYQNHCLFAQVVVDRFATYAGKQFQVRVEGMEHMDRLTAQPESFLTMSSHIGHYELAGYTLRATTKRMNVLMFDGEKPFVMEKRRRILQANNIGMIPVSQDMSHLFEINRVLSQGEVLSMASDRMNGSPKSISVQILGAEARLPQGPFSMATMKSLPVLAVDVMKTASLEYTAYITPLDYDRQAPRAEQIRQLSQAYVDNLERRVRQYPTQWFNYFEFWA